MKRKYYTTKDIEVYALRKKAVCTFGGLNLCVFKYWNAKGANEVKFHRIDPVLWVKKIAK